MSRKPENVEAAAPPAGRPQPESEKHGQAALMQNVLRIVDTALQDLEEVGSPAAEQPH